MTFISPNGPTRPPGNLVATPGPDRRSADFKLTAPALDATSPAQSRLPSLTINQPTATEGPIAVARRETGHAHADPSEAINATVVKRLETVYGSEVAMKIGPQVTALLRGDPMISAAFQQAMSTSQSIASMRQS